jgi:hypothetical protein
LKQIWSMIAFCVFCWSCAAAVEKSGSDLQYDAGYSIPVTGIVSAGKLLSATDDSQSVTSQIQAQLFYTVGQLNALYSVADMNKNKTSVLSINPSQEFPGYFDVVYRAELFVSWDRGRSVPSALPLIMPARPTGQGIQDFINRFGDSCREDFSHAPESGNFWYYYRPQATGCLLRDLGDDADLALVTRFDLTFAASLEQSEGKYPEYDKVWEDRELVVTAIFGMNEPSEDPAGDAGTYAFNSFFNQLVSTFGAPTASNPQIPGQGNPAPANRQLELTFSTQSGVLRVSMLLVDGVLMMTPEQSAFYTKWSSRSDLVSYSGHSGLGRNIRALARMGRFVQGQYQIFFVNGCDTFAYVDNALRAAHQAVNPGFGPDKYIDVITNSMPSYFSSNAPANLTILKALVAKKDTYRTILTNIDPVQRAVVTGEQDNSWPKPFE